MADLVKKRIPLSYSIEFGTSSRRPGPGPHVIFTRYQGLQADLSARRLLTL